ncbi:GMC family oxidoreductase [Rhodovastum atsumiense]|uniref:GMC family oxidoreductase n=3 Tax=Rhodovastum atsumiense TaxID=504468 RepID=A0A5M6IJ58_9PROT|nr:GMC family oxidoreductase [Rhodovastum atsumiense]
MRPEADMLADRNCGAAMSRSAPAVIDDPDLWDVVVIGTGMGGATLGWRLASQRVKILFLEKGRLEVLAGRPAAESSPDPETRLRQGRWPDNLDMVVNGRVVPLQGMRGCGVGGSTLLYAALLERLESHDFGLTLSMPHPTGGWPVSMAEMEPYYELAEQLFRVSGTRDPLAGEVPLRLKEPRQSTRLDAQLINDLETAGLHPYRCHVGIAYTEGCDECLGHACPRQCKSDAKRLCVEPAVRHFGAALRTECEVRFIEADSAQAQALIYVQGGVHRRVRARIFVLAAGALETPLILLRSANTYHPQGLANSSGMVGRNLMFHVVNWLALWPSRWVREAATGKAISARDFYRSGTLRGGVLQSVARKVYSGDILAVFQARLDRSRLREFPGRKALLRILAKGIERLAGNASILALLVEDLPYPENRIELDLAGRPRLTYDIPQELVQRNTYFRKEVSKRLRHNRHFWLNANIELNEGHACGTCRFGTDPKASVLDADCRAHDVANLYVVDASFMPTSGGVNPGLTIAANALRVADVIVRALADPSYSRNGRNSAAGVA